jgi:hypothetical protein
MHARAATLERPVDNQCHGKIESAADGSLLVKIQVWRTTPALNTMALLGHETALGEVV